METLITALGPGPKGELIVENILSDQRYDTAFSGWYWQVEEEAPHGQRLASRSLWERALVFSGTPEGTAVLRTHADGPEDQKLRVLARRISFPDFAVDERDGKPSTKTYIFAVASDLATSRAETARFDATLMWSLGALGAFLTLAAIIQVRVGLAPLRVVRKNLGDIRAGKARRLEGDFPSEIAPLADEMNGLLAHNAAVVDRARTHVGNLAHGLKTPLSVLTTEASATSGLLADTVLKQADVMRRQVEHYLARARAAASAEVLGIRTEIEPVLDDLSRTLGRIYGRRGIDIDVDVAADLAFRGERQDFEELAGNLLDNACKWAKSEVRVSAEAGEAQLCINFEDDGPGLSDADIIRVLEKRERLDETKPGSGLGLGIVRDIADLYGGGLSLSRSAQLGGLTVRLTLPMA
jgi:signal transduction histidine kinase